MINEEFPVTVLVVCDSNFHNLCKDPDAYVEKLKLNLQIRHGDDCKLVTVSGRFGLTKVTDQLPVLDVEDKNKTMFVQTVENHVNGFDELLIVSVAKSDVYLDGVYNAMFDNQKNTVRYSYERKNAYVGEPESF